MTARSGINGRELPSLVRLQKGSRWPTPRTSNGTQWNNVTMNAVQSRLDKTGYHANLEEAVCLVEGPSTAHLNPVWIEWLMGFPLGWTE